MIISEEKELFETKLDSIPQADEMAGNNQLTTIIRESGLDTTKARYILDRFHDSFTLADFWTAEARKIVVTRDDQKDLMATARAGRLALREKRLEIEKARKELKEQALREGKAIDGIANVLKALFVPLEEYFDSQERFTEIKIEKEAARLVAEREAKEQADLLKKQEADRVELERLRIENERQRKEAAEKEQAMQAELKKQQEDRRAEIAIATAQREAAEKKAREQKAALKAKEEAARLEAERLQDILDKKITCPHCGRKFKLPEA